MLRFKKFIRRAWNMAKIYLKKIIRRTKKIHILVVLSVLIGLLLGVKLGRHFEEQKAEEELAKTVARMRTEEQARLDALQEKLDRETKEEPKEIPWYLVLVNFENPMEEGYKPELVEVESGYQVDSRIAKAAKKMLNDAYRDGMRIDVCSAYRSVDKQEQVFNESLKERLNQGMNYWDAFEDNRKSVAEPGTSEHALGLALDLISSQYTKLDTAQENTKEAKWLKENCYKYGFILRYPPEKTDITGIIYEPWHYRYVGVEDATKIMELGITLEEYLETYY
jgi:D-alanyl-D-alanine carboxypeptidase